MPAPDVGAQDPAVVVRLPQALAEHAGGRRELAFDMGGVVTLRDVLARLREQVPAVARRVQDETGEVRRFVNVYVGEEECRRLQGLDTPVAPGQTVFVIGSVAGG